jgi:hypothetical protein
MPEIINAIRTVTIIIFSFYFSLDSSILLIIISATFSARKPSSPDTTIFYHTKQNLQKAVIHN